MKCWEFLYQRIKYGAQTCIYNKYAALTYQNYSPTLTCVVPSRYKVADTWLLSLTHLD